MDEAAALLAWYDAHGRDLPWRRTRDPYALLLAEVMLQQTQVATVAPYWRRFLAEFPTVQALAAADVGRVLRMWAGLGYYRRARTLHAAAKEIAARGWPRTKAALAELPGFGPYTSSSMGAIAFGERELAVDGNVKRVARRYFAANEKAATALAARFVDAARPGDSNQALFDVGATVCTPRAPRCDACPLAAGCAGKGAPAAFDPAPKRARVAEVEVSALFARRGAKVLLCPKETGILAGTWTLPHVEGGRAALGGAAGAPLAEVRHAFTHRRWRLVVYEGTGEGEWVDPADVALSTVFRKAIEAASAATEATARVRA